ncbi:MAG: TRAM domain-containing protein [Chloroflexota bacterium]|nr:TRAM domain-containing protein [Chloroflexota bacterium]
MRIELVLRFGGMIILAFLGWKGGGILVDELGMAHIRYYMTVFTAAIGAIIGLLFTPWFTTRPASWIRRKIRQLSVQELIATAIGLTIGLIVASLLALPLSFLPSPFGKVLPFVGAIIFAYIGVVTAIMRQQDLLNLVARYRRVKEAPMREGNYVLLDTSVIIDGRIADISRTGFIPGTVIVPRFVLNELRHIADSSDDLRRRRGRRGLDMLNKLRKESAVPVQISNIDAREAREVDDKLVVLAKKMHYAILTNDYNLNQVAKLQGVKVLNVNELANAVKALFLPGETLEIKIIQEGKEPGQGVGYLDDGTMVVVEDGRRYIGRTIRVEVTKSLQTTAGRMIFAKPE